MLIKLLWKHTGPPRGFREKFLGKMMPWLKYEGGKEVGQVRK